MSEKLHMKSRSNVYMKTRKKNGGTHACLAAIGLDVGGYACLDSSFLVQTHTQTLP